MTATAVADQLREKIEAGEFRPGHQLPSKNRLAEELGTSTGTVQQAFNALTAEGLTASQPGAGLFVCPPPTQVDLDELIAQFESIEPSKDSAPPWVVRHLGDAASHCLKRPVEGVLLMRWTQAAPAPKPNDCRLTAHSRAASPEEREHLGLRPGVPVLALVFWHFSEGSVAKIERITATGNRIVDFGKLALWLHK